MADDFPQLSDVLRCSQAPVDVNSIEYRRPSASSWRQKGDARAVPADG